MVYLHDVSFWVPQYFHVKIVSEITDHPLGMIRLGSRETVEEERISKGVGRPVD